MKQNLKKVAKGYLLEVLNKGNIDKFYTYFAKGVVFNGVSLTPEIISAQRKELFKIFPDFIIKIEDEIAEGDKVATHVTFSGTYTPDGINLKGIEKKIKYTGIAIDKIENGKVIEMIHVSESWKNLVK